MGRDGEVRVLFEVGADGRARLVNLQGSRQYQTPVRLAVGDLQCHAGMPQQYVLDIRFTEPARGPSTRWASASR